MRALLVIALLFTCPAHADSSSVNLAPPPIKFGPPSGKPPKPLYRSRIQTPRAGGAQDVLKSTKPISNSPDDATREGLVRGTPAYQDLDATPHLDTGPPVPYFDGRNTAVQNLPLPH